MNLEIISTLPIRNLGLPPVLLIPGICHSAGHFKFVLDELATVGVASYALSLRGHGASEPGPVPFWRRGLAEYLMDIHQVVVQIDQPVILVGHSMGGWLAQHYAARHPDLVCGLSLVCSPGPRGPWSATWDMALDDLASLAQIVGHGDCRYYADTLAKARARFYGRGLSDEEVQVLIASLGPEPLRLFLEMLLRWPDIAAIRQKLIPVQVLAAAGDGIICLQETEALARAYATEAKFLQGPHCGPLLAPDAILLAQALASFAKGVAGQ